MESLLAIITVLFYLSASCMIAPSLLHNANINRKPIYLFAVLALISHATLLATSVFSSEGQNFSLLNVASITGFLICLVVTLSMSKMRTWFLLPIVFGVASVNLLAATFLPTAFMAHFIERPALLLHITVALFSYAILTIGTLLSLQLAWLDHRLKTKKSLGLNSNLPPLLMIERQFFQIILIGTVLLTVTLISGGFFIDYTFYSDNWDKAVFTIIAWCIYCVLLWGHFKQGWRGKKALLFSLFACFFLTFAYFGSRLIRDIMLS